MIEAWVFPDARSVAPVGVTLRHDGVLAPRAVGLFASVRARDALMFGGGCTVQRVACGGEIVQDDRSLACSERTVLWSADATKEIQVFARWCVSQVVHLWDAPQTVLDFLPTGESVAQAHQDAWNAYPEHSPQNIVALAVLFSTMCSARGVPSTLAALYASDAARNAAHAANDPETERERQNTKLTELLEGLKP